MFFVVRLVVLRRPSSRLFRRPSPSVESSVSSCIAVRRVIHRCGGLSLPLSSHCIRGLGGLPKPYVSRVLTLLRSVVAVESCVAGRAVAALASAARCPFASRHFDHVVTYCPLASGHSVQLLDAAFNCWTRSATVLAGSQLESRGFFCVLRFVMLP